MVCFSIGIRRGIRIRKSQRHWVNRSSSTACSADVRLGGASGDTEAHQDHAQRSWRIARLLEGVYILTHTVGNYNASYKLRYKQLSEFPPGSWGT